MFLHCIDQTRDGTQKLHMSTFLFYVQTKFIQVIPGESFCVATQL